jgi:ribosome biogenesis GTPase
LPNGGNLIDSPGVREFNLWLVCEQDIMRGFREFQQKPNSCKFRDCKHLVEPGCAILKAVNDGTIHPQRFESYQMLMKEAIVK